MNEWMDIGHREHCLNCLIELSHISVCRINNPFLAQGSRLQPKATPFPVSGENTLS